MADQDLLKMEDQASGEQASVPADANAISMDDWSAALAEQETVPAGLTDDLASLSAASGASTMDDWAAALVEQEESVPVPGGAATQVTPATNLFQDFGQAVGAAVGLGDAQNLDMILDIPVQITVELGRTKIAIRNLLQLAQGSVVELEGLAGEPMDVLVNGCLIAQGEVVVVNDKFGIRLTDIITPAERIRRLQK
ncbi:flagellar motor switch protein FliN [Crenobacter oryzisoli]|uniref:flagellar motor switch protein FliN n=1 Tax=Crenobacter oryzisoli TaxID=3056844 RepID=UPI0032046B10